MSIHLSVRATLAAAASAAVVTTALALPAAAAGAIPMNSGQEADGGQPGGHGFFSYSIDGTEFCWTMSWQGIDDPAAGHVHIAPRQVAGPVVINLDVDGVGGPDESGCREISSDLADAITADPGAYYVNLHNPDFPDGAIRGQLK